ncbi:hypothetical protein ACKWTF_002273 [Chironomus riparius]
MNPVKRNILNFNYIMSRRKQSNPKPLLKRDDDEEFPNEGSTAHQTKNNEMDEMEEQISEKEVLRTSLSENNEDPECLEENKTSKSPLQIVPALRLNVALASDPATNPDAKEFLKIHIKSEINQSGDDEDAEDEYMNPNKDLDTISETVGLQIHSQRSDGSQKSKENINNINQMLVKNLEILPRQNVYMCAPCSIRFSSLSTLEAHSKFYCAHRKDADENPNKSSNISCETNGSEPPTKAIKTGKQYACTQCSYSADKKVSLNRHMRMHQTSPTPSSTATSNGDDTTSSQIIVPASIIGPSLPINDRYCTDCDIRFSSTKTFKAHKQFYCSSRNLEKVKDNQFYCNSRHQGQASSILSPVIVPNAPATSISKSESQTPPEASKTPPTSTSPFLALPTNPIIIIPYSLIRNSSIIPGPLSSVAQVTNPDSTCFIFQNGTLQPIAYSIAPTVVASSSNTQQTSPRSVSQVAINEVKISNPSSAGNIANEALKLLNKRDGIVNRESTTPLDLSVRRSSPNSRERSLSISSAISAEQFRMEFDSMMEGKENLSVSGDSITPEQIVCAPSLPGSPSLTPSRRSNSPRGSSVSMSPNSSTPHSVLMRPLFPTDIAIRLSDPALNVIPPLVKQSMELALRLSSTSEATNAQQISPSHPISSTGTTPTQIPAQIFVKTGISKCKECNIVFCKYENYVAHKQFYCASNLDKGKDSLPESDKKNYCSFKNLEKNEGSNAEQSSLSISPPTTISNNPQTYQQLICLACGIKFASLDNLTTHQKYYCSKANDLQAQPSSIATIPSLQKEKCAKCKVIHDPSQSCAQGSHYKCPICEVVSPNSSEARRHMESHGGVKAFRCTICRYKGNTLRGMRTHIRMHIDKKSGDVNEENYISCILDDDSTEIPPSIVNKVPSTQENSKKNCLKSQTKSIPINCEKQETKMNTAICSK